MYIYGGQRYISFPGQHNSRWHTLRKLLCRVQYSEEIHYLCKYYKPSLCQAMQYGLHPWLTYKMTLSTFVATISYSIVIRLTQSGIMEKRCHQVFTLKPHTMTHWHRLTRPHHLMLRGVLYQFKHYLWESAQDTCLPYQQWEPAWRIVVAGPTLLGLSRVNSNAARFPSRE